MNQEKQLYTRSDITQKLGIQSYILSLWEKEFGLATISSADGQTLYTFQNYEQLKGIKELIYEKGYSLDAAKKALNEHGSQAIRAASPLLFEAKPAALNASLLLSLKNLQKQLHKLRQLI